MENSVIAESDSDAVIIEDSFVDASFTASKKSVVKNQTVFVAESEESEDTDAGDINIPRVSDSVARRSSAFEMKKTILSSDDDVSRAGSIRRQSDTESNKVISSSSDEDEMSPEPKRRPQVKNTRLSESFIGRKTKKRMVLDSDTDNSFIMEHRRRGKLACMKATPLKIGTDKVRSNAVAQMSFQDDDDQSDKSDSSDQNDSVSDENYSETENESDTDSRSKVKRKDKKAINESDESYSESEEKGNDSEKHIHSNNKVNKKTKKQIIESDESYSESEEEGNVSKKDIHSNSHGNTKYNKEVKESDERSSGSDEEDDVSKNDEDLNSKEMRKEVGDSNERINGYDNRESLPEGTDHSEVNNYDDDGPDEDQMAFCRATRMSIMGFLPKENESDDSDYIQSDDTKHTSNGSLAKSVSDLAEAQEHNNNSPDTGFDDDIVITIIDQPPEVIALSSDDEEVQVIKDNKSPNTKKNKSRNDEENIKVEGSIKQFLVPTSPPKQAVYVQKHVRENELAKLHGYKEELQNLRYLLDNMDMETLPDGGVKLIERLTALEGEVQRQADKVHGMVVAPDEAEGAISAGKAKKTPTWEDIQKASNAVQPRMFGKQAMATHMAERNLIMERLRDLHESLASRPSDEARAPAPAAVRSELMPHQLQALAWLRWRETQRPPGGILADDMGLGKTITMISLIAQDKEAGIDGDDDDDSSSRGRVIHGGTLVVCPVSLLQQWAGEVGKHCAPHALSVAQHHGATRAHHPHRLAASDLVLTTYNILQRESDKSGVLTKVTWRRVILDEAHVVRNHKSATSNAVAALRARRRWALTGTPLHNKDLDLFALLKFLKCTPFDELTMWKKWIDNKSMGGEERLSMIMRCLMLRRTKAQLQASGQLACLPERTAHERPVTLSKEEMNVYQKVLVTSKTLFAQFLHQRAEKQVDANGLTRMQKDNAYALHKKMAALRGVKPVKSHEILVLLLRLRQMCCHCGLISAMLSEEDDVQEDPAGQDLLAELNKLSLEDSRAARKSGGGLDSPDGEETGGKEDGASVEEAIRSALSLKNPVFRLERRSAKIAAVMDCLNSNVFPNKGEKAVVVSQWTSVLRLVERELRAARVRCTTLCGSVPVAARAALVDSLNDPQSDVRVMLLSLCAGGVGLNLCGASHLLLLDPHWNPQLEQQAQDRVYRVGQHRHVHIYRFMCVDTVEQTIRTLQAAKLELADNILTGARHAPASKLTIDDLKLLFNMGPNDAK